MSPNEKKLKPFVKWIGGKTKLLCTMNLHIPDDFQNYYEPFVGGGSLLYHLINNAKVTDKTVITVSDINNELIDCYKTIQNNVEELILELEKPGLYVNEMECYYRNRNAYNSIKKNPDSDKIQQSALFLYLNKTGFNGMYRENSKGEFNVPFGKMKNPVICDAVLLREISKAFNTYNIIFRCCDYNDIATEVKTRDFIYIDSPYDSTFTDYYKTQFGRKQQNELKSFVDTLSDRGARVLMSNSSTEFIQDLYKGYHCIFLPVKYSISRTASDRKKVIQEVLISNKSIMPVKKFIKKKLDEMKSYNLKDVFSQH